MSGGMLTYRRLFGILFFGLGFILGYFKAVYLSEEQRRVVQKALFELREMPRRLLI